MIYLWTPHMRTSTSLEGLETWSKFKNGLIENRPAKVNACYSYVVNFAHYMCLDFYIGILWSWLSELCTFFRSLTDEAWVGVYTLKDCYPVQETYAKNSSVTTSTRFFDLQLGISDPEVFDPPSTCQSALSEKMTSDCWIPHSSLLITVHINHNTETASKELILHWQRAHELSAGTVKHNQLWNKPRMSVLCSLVLVDSQYEMCLILLKPRF